MKRGKGNNSVVVEEVFSLPSLVHSRLLFQVGPKGEDPIVDAIENVFRSEGLRVNQEDSSSITLKAFSQEALARAKQRLSEWVGSIEVTSVKIEKSSPMLVRRLERECSQFLNNMSWICSASVVNNSIGGCSVDITGKPEAVNLVAETIYQIIVETGGADKMAEAKRSLFPHEENRQEPSDLPKYKLVRELQDCGEYSSVAPQVIPLSVFEPIAGTPPLPSIDVEVFKRAFKIEKSDLVPKQVFRRLEDAVGPGTRISLLSNNVVDIRVSSSETDLSFSEQLVRACVSRSAPKGAHWAKTVNKLSLDRSTVRSLEKKRKIVTVNVGEDSLLLLGRPLAVLCAQTELERMMRKISSIGEGNELLGNLLAENIKEGALICKRVEQASTGYLSQAAVELVNKNLVLVTETEEQKKFAIDLIEFLIGRGKLSHHVSQVPVPAGKLDRKTIVRIERETACVIVQGTDWMVNDSLIVGSVNSSEETEIVSIIAYDVENRLRGIVAILQLCPNIFDWASLKFGIEGGGFITAFINDGGIDDFGKRIQKAMGLAACMHLPQVNITVIAGTDRESVNVSAELVLGKSVSSFGYRSIVESGSLDNLKVIEPNLGCFIRANGDRVEVYSKFASRRVLACMVVGGQISIDEAVRGWDPVEKHEKVSRPSLRRKKGDSDDEYYDFGGG
jgi:hypothetical protein